MFVRINVTSATLPLLYLDPSISHASQGETFFVDVMVADVERLYTWEINVTFDPDVLQFVNVTEGDFLASQAPNGTWTVPPAVKDGEALFGWSIIGSFIGPTGDGWLGTIEFEVVGEGETVLNISHPETYLLEYIPPPPPPGKSVMEEIPHTRTNGFFTNIETPPQVEFTHSPEIPLINQEVTFDASASSVAPARNITRYEWDFGDGTALNSTDPIVTHTYSASGTYEATLVVIDDAPATALLTAVFNTTTMPRIWYELYSADSATIAIAFGHDIAVTNIQVSTTEVTVGETVYINVTVENKGATPEDFKVVARYDETAIEEKSVTALDAGSSITLSFSWDTTGVEPGVYTISAEAIDVEDEGNPQDNERIDGTVEVLSGTTSFPIELVVAGVAIAIVAIGGLYFFMRRRSAT
jgi:PKD repeat protein